MRISNIIGLLSVASVLLLASQIQLSSGLAVMSIDLSSEWIKVAIVKPGVPMEIVLNKESSRKTPVSIAVRDEETLYGDPALSVGVRYPKNNYFYLHDLLGKGLENPLVKLYHKRFPFYTLGEDTERGTVYFQHNDDLHFYPEELLAIALNKSREVTEDFAEQIIKDVVITVPAYFNQAERRSILYAAELAGLRVLQLMNDNAAVALNYGAFRRSDFNATPQNIMFYDMGAGSTTATIVSYQLVKTKEKGIQETNPQLSIKGVGFDRTLGGLEWEIRLRRHLAALFNKQGKTSNKVETSDRAMAKLMKEAKRVKKVLSANVDITAQVEGLLDDKDFKAHVSRAELEEMCSDLFKRVGGPVERALKSSEMTMDEIDQVILVGGGTRVPKVQETLLKVTGKKELGKGINADEAAALGAVYQAAELSKGFKVKKFLIKDANVFPIQVQFERVTTDGDGEETTRTIKRTLFGQNNPFPQKKVMTFNRHYDDFNFQVNYGDLDKIMTPEELKAFGSTKLTEVSLSGVKNALDKNAGAEHKGIKAHFRMDESGILHLDAVESVFERVENVTENETQEEQSTLAKLGSTISRFFSGSSSDDDDKPTTEEEDGSEGETEADQEEKVEGNQETANTEEEKPTGEDAKRETEDQTLGDETSEGQEREEAKADGNGEEDAGKSEEKTGDDTEKSDKSEEPAEGEGEKKTEETKEEPPKEEKTVEEKPSKPKVVTKKENITVEVQVLDLNDPSKESKKASRKKLRELQRKEEARREKEKALNSLEAFIFDMQDKLYSDDYEVCSTEEEREELRSKLSEASDWLYDQEPDVTATAYKNKLKELKKLTKLLIFRVEEYKERPSLIDTAKTALNASYYFLLAAKNVTGEDLLYTEVEVGLLEKAYNETNEWFTTKLEEQERTSLTEKPVLLTSELQMKLIGLEREVRYLVGKAKSKPRPKKKKPEKSKSKLNTTETENGDKVDGGEEKKEADEKEKIVEILPEGEDAEGTPAENPDGEDGQAQDEPTQAPAEGEEKQSPEEPTQATPEQEEQLPEEPLQLETPSQESTQTPEKEEAPTEGMTTEEVTTEKVESETEHSHLNEEL